ncbi:MAG TPA: pitrilysin family protein [Dokdonella sp.]|nr:pitrilysin family protein [Dokdonella sp.]
MEDLSLNFGRFVGMRVQASPLVALVGSFRTPIADGRTALLQQLAVRLLVGGTQQRDRRSVADVFERSGASLSFESGAARVTFSALACTEDLPMLADFLAQCLVEPHFDPDGVARERATLAAELRRHALDPRARASAVLSRRLFEAGHPHHEPTLDERIGCLETLTVDDVRACHAEMLGAHELKLVALGGIDPAGCAAEFERRLRPWRRSVMPAARSTPLAMPDRGGTTWVPDPGARSSSVFIGTRISFEEADGVAAWLANRILGGSYASRLVASLREAQALTYSVHSELVDPQADVDGLWRIAVALSPDKLERGIAAARSELRRFADAGVTIGELERQRRSATGALLVDAASLQGMGSFLLRNMERGAAAVHIEAFVDALETVSTQRLQRVAATLEPARLETVIVGTLGGSRATCEQQPYSHS